MCILVQGFSIKAFMSEIMPFRHVSIFWLSYKDSLQKVLMTDMLTRSSELMPTTNVHSHTRVFYKSAHAFLTQIGSIPHGSTAGFLRHGRRARIFGQIFDQIFCQDFDQGF